MKVNFIRSSYTRFYEKHKKEVLAVLDGRFKKGSLIMESEVENFEKNFAKFCKKKYCIIVRSGTDALILASKFREPSIFSNYRYRLPIEYSWKKCALVTYMNSSLENQVTAKALKEKGFFIIEDACQAVGRPLIGDISCFSFYPAKMLGGIGKGGALVTDNKEIYLKLKAIRDDKWNNLWLDEPKAAYLNMKLKYLPQMLKRRKEIADIYYKSLKGVKPIAPDMLQNFVVEVDKPKQFIEHMKKNGVEVFADKNDFYVGASTKAVRLPIYPEMNNREVSYVVKTVNSFYDKK